MSDRLDLGPLENEVRAEFDAKFAAREIGLKNSRLIIRASANAIRSLHRGERSEAARLMTEAGSLLAEASAALVEHPDITHAGFLSDATKEYAEARLTDALMHGDPIPLPSALGIDPAPYLNGLGEAVGEMRRRLLDLLRAGDIDGAELALMAMADVLDLLAGLDYPDGMTRGLRRTTDVARALIERSRADLTTTVVQERLVQELRRD